MPPRKRTCYLCKREAIEPVAIPVHALDRGVLVMQWACTACAEQAELLEPI